ncbi:hypothetical protein F4778DRAFT_293251 [Xylariomycetidae sp. FL2044]|nr:hypothetical protein F4778DRAFT_293251 [Xylariomycetidae sp. FL2044]
MGWLWASPSTPTSKGASPENTRPNGGKPEVPPPKAPEAEYSDPEIAKFMAQIQAEFGGSSSKPAERQVPAEPALPPPRPVQEPEKTSTPKPPSSSWSSFWGSSKPTTSSDQEASTPSSSSSSSTSPSPRTTTTTTTTTIRTANPALDPTTPESSSSETPPTRLDPLSESLLPTTMSCRDAFDAAYHCNGLGGQWTSIYRQGTLRSCSDKWDDFWFCMRTRSYPERLRAEAVRDRYRAKEVAKYRAPGRRSSADVWEPRTERLAPGEAFSEPLEMPDVSDEEWRRMEIQKRRMVLDMLRRQEEEDAAERARNVMVGESQ